MNTADEYSIWSKDQLSLRAKASAAYLFHSLRIGGDYEISRQASVNLQSECRQLGDSKEAERLKARIATILIDRQRQGETTSRVDVAMIESVSRDVRILPVAKRARRLLRFIVRSTQSIGEEVYVWSQKGMELALGWSESIDFNEVEYLLKYLREADFIDRTSASGYCRATVSGFESIEQEDVVLGDTSKVFVALWFNETTNALRTQIESSIRAAGYDPIIVDNQTFDGLIDDAIIAGIRRARFVIADLTHGTDGMRGSVYYEAGLARGQDKSVILTAHESHVNEKKIAFDLDHYPILQWTSDDLQTFGVALQNRIESLFGKGSVPEK